MSQSTQKLPATAFSAQLFLQLSRMEAAGLPAIEAFSLIETTDSSESKRLRQSQQYLKKGLPMSEAGFKSGIFNEIDKSLVHAGEASGQLIAVYKQLADYYEDKFMRWKKIKSRLYFPILILTLALFVQPIPLLVASKISVAVYLQMSLGRLVLLALAAFLMCKLPRVLELFGLSGLFYRLQLSTPKVKKWIEHRQINQFLFILAMMLEAGVAFSVALPKAVKSIKNTQLRNQFKPALKGLTTGASVTELLLNVNVIKPITLQIIRTGEESGTLARSLLHFSKQEAETISIHDEMFAEWLPRIVYLVIALWMANSILGSSFSSVVPEM